MWQTLFITFWFRKMMIIPLHIYVKATLPLTVPRNDHPTVWSSTVDWDVHLTFDTQQGWLGLRGHQLRHSMMWLPWNWLGLPQDYIYLLLAGLSKMLQTGENFFEMLSCPRILSSQTPSCSRPLGPTHHPLQLCKSNATFVLSVADTDWQSFPPLFPPPAKLRCRPVPLPKWNCGSAILLVSASSNWAAHLLTEVKDLTDSSWFLVWKQRRRISMQPATVIRNSHALKKLKDPLNCFLLFFCIIFVSWCEIRTLGGRASLNSWHSVSPEGGARRATWK